MIISSLLHWWYIDGWLGQLTKIRWAFIRMADYFSIGLLIQTLFSPFRQISVDETSRSAGGRVNVIIDKLMSRLIGCIARLIMMIIGIIALILLTVFSLVRLIFWPLMPIMPLVSLVLMGIVGAPWTLI